MVPSAQTQGCPLEAIVFEEHVDEGSEEFMIGHRNWCTWLSKSQGLTRNLARLSSLVSELEAHCWTSSCYALPQIQVMI